MDFRTWCKEPTRTHWVQLRPKCLQALGWAWSVCCFSQWELERHQPHCSQITCCSGNHVLSSCRKICTNMSTFFGKHQRPTPLFHLPGSIPPRLLSCLLWLTLCIEISRFYQLSLCGVTHAAQTDYSGNMEAAKRAKNTPSWHGHAGQK